MGQILRMSKKPALLFDLDGTLVDSLPDVQLSMNEALAARGRRELERAEVYDMIGKGGSWLCECAIEVTGGGSHDDAQSLLTDFLKIYGARPAAVSTLFPNAIETLQDLKDAGHPMAICTNKPRATTEPVLAHFGLDAFFSLVLCADDVQHRKPDGRHLLEALTTLRAQNDTAIMIGDSENDILAAQDAALASVFVTFGYCHAPQETLRYTAAIDDLASLPQVIETLSAIEAEA